MKSKLLLTPKDIAPSFPDWNVDGVINPAAIRLKNRKILLFIRIAESINQESNKPLVCPIIISKDNYKTSKEKVSHKEIITQDGNLIHLKSGICKLSNISHFRKVILDESGFIIEKIDKTPSFFGLPEHDELGVEDPRITKIGDTYYMTYVSVSKNNGVCTSLASSKDCLKWKRHGIIFSEQNKDSVIFPEKINNLYIALNRPETLFDFSRPGIWISYSPDLIFWGKEKSIMKPRENSWEVNRIGSGPPPIRTLKGWLLIYHGVKMKNKKAYYSAGAVLLDKKNPEKIIARTPIDKPLLIPDKSYQKKGFKNNVVFPTGVVLTLDKQFLLIYSGGADSVISVDKFPLDKIYLSLKKI